MLKSILLSCMLLVISTMSYPSDFKLNSILGGALQSKISMNVRVATCLPATIDNVSFGSIDAATILSGEIEGHTTLSLDCTGADKPQRVSIFFDPADPHLTMASSGYIGSKNTTLGYLVSWGDSQIGSIGEGVPMGKELFFKKTEASLMKLKLKIQPVVFPLGGNTVSLGSGNTHVTIKIKYI